VEHAAERSITMKKGKTNKSEVLNIRKQLVEIGKKLDAKGYVVGPGGNTSARVGDVVYMKASGICFEEATINDYIGVDINSGEIVDGKKRPTCEILMHLGCYLARADVKAVIHSHPPLSIAYGMQGETMKQFTPDFVAMVNSPVPVIDYVITGGRELADKITPLIKTNHNGVFMCNHGLLTVGENLSEAYYRHVYIEDSVKSVVSAKILGKMKYMTDEQIKQLDEAEFEDYRRTLIKMKN
jgi:L-fuculose-phosphate aldolase